MTRSDYTAEGFFLALHLVESLGERFDRAAVIRRLVDVAKGEATVFGSPEEEVADLERRAGRPLSPDERAAFLDSLSHRGEIDATHRAAALRVLKIIRRDLDNGGP